MRAGAGGQATRPPAVAARAMAASSQPLATSAALRMLEQGGNAADAALTAAAVLCVAEPMSTGIGGDLFALVWRDGEPGALDSAGPAPATVDATTPVAERGPRSVTVPGAVAGWAELAERYGRRGLDACLAAAIEIAERGFAIGDAPPRACGARRRASRGVRAGAAARRRVRLPDLAATLRRIAAEGPRRDLPRRGRRGHRRGDLARGVRPRGVRAALGRAAAARLRRRRGARAAAADPGRRRARGARRPAGAGPGLASRLTPSGSRWRTPTSTSATAPTSAGCWSASTCGAAPRSGRRRARRGGRHGLHCAWSTRTASPCR